MMLRISVLAVAFVAIAGTAMAQEEVEEEGPWSGYASLGFLSTSGNTDTTNYNTTLGVGFVHGKWKHSLDGAANGAADTDVTTAEAYQAGWKSEYNFTDSDFLFGTVDWRKDRFSGVDRQVTEAVGYGRRLIDTPRHLLSAGLGVGHRSATLSDGVSESSVIARGNIDYNWIFSETSGFDQSVIIETGSDNTYLESVSAIRARLLGDFALVLAYTIKQNSDVPVGSEKTDRLSSISIEYAF